MRTEFVHFNDKNTNKITFVKYLSNGSTNNESRKQMKFLKEMENGVRWLFPTSHAIMEIHFDEIYREPVMDLRWSYIYYIVLILLLFIAAFLCIDKYDFSKIQELEE